MVCCVLYGCMASVKYVFHIVSQYDRSGDVKAGADMIDYNSMTALHDISHSIGFLCIGNV